MSGKVKLISSDKQEFDVDNKVARMNEYVATRMDAGERVILLDTVSGKSLSKVLEYCVYHAANPSVYVPPQKPEDYHTDDIIPWDLEFCKVDQVTLFELILAANVLKNTCLEHIMCKTVANMIKGKTPQEIKRKFNIKNDFTLKEVSEVRKEIRDLYN